MVKRNMVVEKFVQDVADGAIKVFLTTGVVTIAGLATLGGNHVRKVLQNNREQRKALEESSREAIDDR